MDIPQSGVLRDCAVRPNHVRAGDGLRGEMHHMLNSFTNSELQDTHGTLNVDCLQGRITSQEVD